MGAQDRARLAVIAAEVVLALSFRGRGACAPHIRNGRCIQWGVSAAQRDPNAAEELRPTTEAFVRPTREPRAPFVPGPQSPRVAPAPRAGQLRAMPAVAKPPVVPRSIVVASFPRERVPGVISALRDRGLDATQLREAQPGPAGLSRELSHAVVRATIVATSLGGIGALIGALIVPAEALVPGFGWIPGPAVGAALLAGVLGALGFALGMLALLLMPARALKPLAAGDRALIAIVGPDATNALAAAIELAGTPVAHE